MVPDTTDPGRSEIVAMLRGAGASTLAPTDAVAAAAERLLVLIQRWCAYSPLVLVLDDLQWADEVSLSLVRRLHEVSLQAPLLLVAACRPVPARPEVDSLRDTVIGKGSVLVELGPLAPDQVGQLVADLVGAAVGPHLASRAALAAGNPLYVRELVDAWARENRIRIQAGTADLTDPDANAPRTLAAAISARLDFLTQPTRAVCGVAALLAAHFTVEHLALAAGRTPVELLDLIDEAIGAGVLTPHGSKLAFRHPLIRQSLSEQIPAGVRSGLHRHTAQMLDQVGEPIETVAEHVLAATNARDVWTRTWTAEHAPTLIHRAPHLAASLLQRAREQMSADDPRRDHVDAHLVRALHLTGRYDDSVQLAQSVLTHSRDPHIRAQMAWSAGHGLRGLGRYDQALAVTEHELQNWAELIPHWRARLRALQAVILLASGRYPEGEAAAVQAQEEGIATGDRIALAYSLQALANARFRLRPDPESILKIVNQAFEVLSDDPDGANLRTWLRATQVALLENSGRVADAEHALAIASLEAEQSGLAPQISRIRAQAADFHFGVGRWDDAITEVESLTDSTEAMPVLRVWMHGIGALISHHRDDRSGYAGHQRAVAEFDTTSGDLHYVAEVLHIAEALTAERNGDPVLAVALLRARFEDDGSGRYAAVNPIAWAWMPDLVRLALAVDDLGTAEAATRACTDQADDEQQPQVFAAAKHCRGQLDADTDVLEAAVASFAGMGYRLWQSQALEDAAVAHAHRGDPAAARTAYHQAIDIYTTLSAAWNIRRADTRLRELGIRRGRTGPRSARPMTGWLSLTPTENQIANLVAAGLSNPDIAEQLVISRRTVGTHVTHILAKLDARSRVDIAREAVRHRLLERNADQGLGPSQVLRHDR